jgi:hypothetical protein
VALDRVQPLKIESIDTGGDANDLFPTGVDAQHDYYEGAGLVINDPTHRDETTVIDRVGNDMKFKDGNNPSGFTLSQLAAGGGSGMEYVEYLLGNDPIRAGESSYAITYSGSSVTKEEWKRGDLTLVKSADYTYVSSRCTQEVVKVFALDGTTVLAQVTWTYTYSSGKISSGSMTRDV